MLTAQLELPHGMELAGPVVIVLINSTATIGRQRAEFMDLVLPVLLRLAQAAGVCARRLAHGGGRWRPHKYSSVYLGTGRESMRISVLSAFICARESVQSPR